jgi:hypothetical protein
LRVSATICEPIKVVFDGLLIFSSRDDDGEAKLIASDPERASDLIFLRPLWRIPAFDFGQGGGFRRLYY